MELNIPNHESSLKGSMQNGRFAAMDGETVCRVLVVFPLADSIQDGPALIILALVTANIRNCRLPSSKVRALDVLLALSCRLTDEAKLDRMVPYIIELLHDESALVRSAALRTLMQTVRRYVSYLKSTY